MEGVTYAHIEVDSNGVAYVAGTRTKVLEVALDRIAHHWDAGEIHRQHPHLSLEQIHAALAYYFGHKDALGAEIEEQLRLVTESRETSSESLVRAKLASKS